MTMTTKNARRRLLVLAGLTAALLAAAGCGDDNSATNTVNSNQSPAPTATGTAGPITVPTIDEPDLTPQQAQTMIEKDVTQQCGGEMCVKLTIESSDDEAETCQFVDTDPEAGEEVPRGGEITIISGTQPCSTPTPGGSASPGATPTASPGASPTASPTATPTE